MCARVDQDEPAIKRLRRLGLAVDANLRLGARREVFPRHQLAVVRRNPEGRLQADWAHWGLVPAQEPDPKAFLAKWATYNARAETVAEKPTFAAAFRDRRCAIPVLGFYEHADKKPQEKLLVAVCGLQEPILWLAGLWSRHPALGLNCTIITTEPNALIGQVHSRMPVILSRRAVGSWLDQGGPELLRPWTATPMAMFNWAGRPTWAKVRANQVLLNESAAERAKGGWPGGGHSSSRSLDEKA